MEGTHEQSHLQVLGDNCKWEYVRLCVRLGGEGKCLGTNQSEKGIQAAGKGTQAASNSSTKQGSVVEKHGQTHSPPHMDFTKCLRNHISGMANGFNNTTWPTIDALMPFSSWNLTIKWRTILDYQHISRKNKCENFQERNVFSNKSNNKSIITAENEFIQVLTIYICLKW